MLKEVPLVGFSIIMDEFGNLIIEKKMVDRKKFREFVEEIDPECDHLDEIMEILNVARLEVEDAMSSIIGRFGVIK